MTLRHRRIWLLIGLFVLLRWVASFSFGLGGDEAYYVLYGRKLALSYFDHPPLVGWFQALFHYPLTAIFGLHDWIARVPAIVLFAAASYLSYRLIYSVTRNERVGMLCLLALNSSVLLNVLGLMMLPDCLLLVTIQLLIFTLMAIDEKPKHWRNWLWLGVVLGVSGLAKYTAFLFLFPTAWFLVSRRLLNKRTWPKLLAAAALGLLIVSPVIIWNAEHDWISFRYQGDHVVGAGVPINWKGFFLSVGRQFLAYGPPLFLVSFFGLWRAFRSRHLILRLSSWFGLVLALFFGASALYKVSLPHWTSPFFVLFIPIGFYFMVLDIRKKWERWLALGVLGFSLAMVACAFGLVILKPVRFDTLRSPFRDVGDYAELMKRANEELAKDPAQLKVIGITNWSLASRIMYYNLPYSSETKVFDNRVDQFGLWNPKDYLGGDVLFLINYFLPRDVEQYYHCGQIEPVGTVDLPFAGTVVDRYKMVWCRRLAK